MDVQAMTERAESRPRPRVVHEAETQRQHIRINLPVELETSGGIVHVENWSIGGIGIRDLLPAKPVGSIFEARLVFPLQGFSFGMPVTLDVRHVTNGITGCRFAELDAKQLSVLQFLVSAYMAGRLVSSDEVLAITSRNNFDKPRGEAKAKQSDVQRAVSGARRLGAIAVLVFLGLALLGFVGTAIYERLFITSYDGTVSTPTLSIIRAPANGSLLSLKVSALSRVKDGEVIGSLSDIQNKTIDLISPCECIVLGTPVSKGTWVQANNSVALVAPEQATVVVELRALMRQSSGLSVGDRVTLSYYNDRGSKRGTVTSVQRFTPTSRSADDGSATLESHSLIQIAPDEPDALTDFGEPVRISFDRLQLFAGKAPEETAAQ